MLQSARAKRALLAFYIGLAAGLAAATVRTVLLPTGVVATDFSVFATGWWMILHGQGSALYDANSQAAAQTVIMKGAHFEGGLLAFLNPPHAAVAGLPLGWVVERVGVGTAFVLSIAVNIGLLFVLDRGLKQTLGIRGAARPLMTAGLLAFYPVFEVIKLGQVSLLLAVAILGLYRGVNASRHVVAAGWLLVLSIKPQLLLPIAVFLICRGCYRVLVWSAMLALVAVLITSIVLGPSIWLEYVRHIGQLEQFFGTGTADYMLNARGSLLRLAPGVSPHAIRIAAFALALAASGCLATFFWFSQVHRDEDGRLGYALAVAVALLFSPHLFVQDVVIWAVPLSFVAWSAFRAAPRRLSSTVFILLAPIVFTLAHFTGSTPASSQSQLSLNLQFAILALATAVTTREYLASRNSSTQMSRHTMPLRHCEEA